MRSSWLAGKLAVAVTLVAGCSRQAENVGSRAPGTARPAVAADKTVATAPPAQSTTAIEADNAASAGESPDAMRPVMLALDDRTVMGQPLTTEVKERWSKAVRVLASENPSLVHVVTAQADADWLLEVAALERTDIIYLAPVPADGIPPSDDLLRMSPPGEAAITWLKAELETIARDAGGQSANEAPTGDLDALTDQLTELLAEPPVEPAAEPLPTAAPAPPDPNDDNPRLAEYERAKQEMEQARRHYEQRRAETAGFKAASLMFHHGPAEDLKAQIVEEQSATYHTANRTQAVLGTYGKMIDGNRLLHRLARFEQRSIVQQLDRVRRFVTVEREGRGNSQDFISLVGNRQAWEIVDLAAEISAGRRRQVAFEIVGLRLDQNDVIRALNADRDALSYFEYLRRQNETPCLVLENVVFTSYAAASEGNLTLGGKAKTILTSDGLGARTENRRGSFTRFAAPLIRCYQPYEVKLVSGRVVELSYLEP